MTKTKEQLEDEISVRCKLDEERRISDLLYAKKIVERIVYGAIGLICCGFIYLLLSQIKWR